MKIHSLFLLLSLYILQSLNFPFLIDSNSMFCSCQEPYYTRGSTFQSNLQHLLADLHRNASQNNYSYNTTYGKAPDQAYGLAICYADASLSACKSCLSEVSTGVFGCCDLKKQGIAWDDSCMGRYSDVAFNASNNIGPEGRSPKGDHSKIEHLSDPEKFRRTLRQLVNDLAANASTTPLKVAVGTTKYTRNANIYTLVQCTRQILADECRGCVGDLIDFGIEGIKDQSSIVGDVMLRTVSCYVRYAFEPFYVIPEVHPPYAWSNTGKPSREPVAIHILAITIGALFVLLADVLGI